MVIPLTLAKKVSHSSHSACIRGTAKVRLESLAQTLRIHAPAPARSYSSACQHRAEDPPRIRIKVPVLRKHESALSRRCYGGVLQRIVGLIPPPRLTGTLLYEPPFALQPESKSLRQAKPIHHLKSINNQRGGRASLLSW
jgi:hypothetical protein